MRSNMISQNYTASSFETHHRLTFQTMSEPFPIFFKSEKVGIRYIHSLYMLNNVWITLNIISIGTTPNRMLFNPTDIPNNVRTIPNNFKILKCPNQGQ